jgi:hypothetical protein
MILLLTRSDDVAADVLVLKLEELEFPFVRVNTDLVPDRYRLSWTLRDATIVTASRRRVALGSVTSVWCRKAFGSDAPLPDDGYPERFVERESLAALNGMIETAPARYWMNRPAAIRRAEHKLLQLRVAVDVGFHVPPTLVSNDAEAVRAFVDGRDVIVKAVKSARTATSSGDRMVYTSGLDGSAMLSDAEIEACPTIYQARVRKDHEMRVTVIGDTVFATRIRTPPAHVDWRAAPSEDVAYKDCTVPPEFGARCRAMLRKLDLRYGAFDFAVTAADEPYFLEVNPGGQWAWLERATGVPMTDALARALHAADLA